MTALIFFITMLTLIVLIVRLLIRLMQKKPIGGTLKLICGITLVYGSVWIIFDLTRKRVPVPMGTDVCFDDWCATVDSVSQQPSSDSIHFVLYLKMSNHAGGIAQSPSEPRVHIIDSSDKVWLYSVKGQQSYQTHHGVQPGIEHRLELHQSLKTELVFALPKIASGCQVLIEEGPWITHLLFPEDQLVFALKN